MEVVVGSYDEVLLGYRIIKINEEYQFEQSFTDHSHTGCVKSLDISTRGILASGGTDECIRLFNLKKRAELGSLVHHTGSITWLEFHKGAHLFSASEDGNICIWKSFTWECLKTLKGHKSAVHGIAVHPSGKLALSVGKDKTLRTWNLITGKSAYITNIKQAADLVMWSPDGGSYIVICNNKIDVYQVETASIQFTITAERRINSAQFLNDKILIYSGDGGIVYFHDIKDNICIHSTDTETVRTRGLSVLESDEGDGTQWLITSSSDGYIKLWEVNILQHKISTRLLAQHNTNFRLTCLAVKHEKSESENKNNIVKSKEKVKKIKSEKTEEFKESKEKFEALDSSDENSAETYHSDMDNSDIEHSDSEQNFYSKKPAAIQKQSLKTKRKVDPSVPQDSKDEKSLRKKRKRKQKQKTETLKKLKT